MKLVVETTGDFQIALPGPEQHANAFRPSVIRPTARMHMHIAGDRIRAIAQVNDEASDSDLAKWLKQGHTVQEFIDAHPVQPALKSQPDEPVTVKTAERGGRKSKESTE